MQKARPLGTQHYVNYNSHHAVGRLMRRIYGKASTVSPWATNVSKAAQGGLRRWSDTRKRPY